MTADVVLFTVRANALCVLLVQRRKDPFRGAWALPGGYVERNEPLDRAALRELNEETGVTGVTLEQVGAFGDPGRDPRGHTVTVAFVGFVLAETPLRAGDDAVRAVWHPVRKVLVPSEVRPGEANRRRSRKPLTVLAFDHGRIIAVARHRLQQRLVDHRDPRLDLVPEHFTLSELQHMYEAVLGVPLDRRNFRARLVNHHFVEPISGQRTGRHRPAQLYRWSSHKRPE